MKRRRLSGQEIKTYHVGEVLVAADFLIKSEMPYIRVKGQISNFRPSASQHAYFSLKDNEGVLNAVLFQRAWEEVTFELANDIEVVCEGQLGIYVKQGRFQLIVEKMKRVGIGQLAIAFEKLKRQLEAEGLFDASRKRPLPRYPRRIGIVTSLKGAALRDMLSVIRRRYPLCSLLIAPAAVQGSEAPPQIVQALELLNRQRHLDLIILGRGGGSIEDLWAFNEESVARAVAASQIPVITGVGHETDFTIVDFVADRRAPTPSAAAELAVPQREQIRSEFDAFRQRLRRILLQQIHVKKVRLNTLRHFLVNPENQLLEFKQKFRSIRQNLVHLLGELIHRDQRKLQKYSWELQRFNPQPLVEHQREQFKAIRQQLFLLIRQKFQKEKSALKLLEKKLEAISPLAVLKRGYALVYREDGSLFDESGEVRLDELLEIHWHRRVVRARVEKVIEDEH